MTELAPATTALLIMDLQPSITAQLPDPETFIGGVLRAREAARAAGAVIGYVRVALTEDDIASVPASNVNFHAAAATGRLLDGPDTQVDPRIAPADDEIVVRKSRVSAFSTTDLREQLETQGVDTIVLCGISTSGVVLSTVRDAADHDFRIVVLEDGCFDRDPDVHRVLTEKIFPRQAEVTSIADFVDALS
ncbi:MAG TPA: isochorismatase family cysteine hydrolase [Diaminobutyricibacter sp.]|uniref:cysteine hydrolase family protein n=1 Tax=Leifsonia sp. McL0618 TaxID=3415677 RepID=UPI00336C97C9